MTKRKDNNRRGIIYWLIVDNDTSVAEFCTNEEDVMEVLGDKDDDFDPEEFSVMKVQLLEEFSIEETREFNLKPIKRM